MEGHPLLILGHLPLSLFQEFTAWHVLTGELKTASLLPAWSHKDQKEVKNELPQVSVYTVDLHCVWVSLIITEVHS